MPIGKEIGHLLDAYKDPWQSGGSRDGASVNQEPSEPDDLHVRDISRPRNVGGAGLGVGRVKRPVAVQDWKVHGTARLFVARLAAARSSCTTTTTTPTTTWTSSGLRESPFRE